MPTERPRWDDPVALITPELKSQYEEDGVVMVPQALHPEWLMLLELALIRVMGDAAITKHRFYHNEPGEFIETVRNFDTVPELQRLMYDSPIADMIGALIGSDNVWLYSDEWFIKTGGNCARTPWHQDTTYYPLEGEQIASMWISLDPLPKAECLEYIPGSHRGPRYDGFDPTNLSDPTNGFYGQDLPRLPDIEAEREKWNIVSWDITPGDVILANPGVLHGGGPTSEGRQRRAITIRCYGEDIVFADRPPSRPTVPLTPGLSLHLKPGDKLRAPWYPQLRPAPDGQQW